MRWLRFVRLGLCCWATVAVVACGGAPPGSVTPEALGALGVHAHGSWMMPQASGADLIYVTDVKTDGVLIYSYPGGKMMGHLAGFGSPRGECVDAAGDVWIADAGGDDIVEYAHGGTQPLAALNTAGPPTGCSVDPVTGNLAVSGGVSGLSVTIFRHMRNGWGSAHRFSDVSMGAAAFCGYDAAGNLFVDGVGTKTGAFTLAELPRLHRSFAAVKLRQAIGAPGQVQWDGSALAIGDAAASPAVVYRFTISAGVGTKVGSTALGSSREIRQFWIQTGTLIGPDPAKSNVGLWNYPAGGSPTQTLSGGHAFGAVVSLAQ